VSRGLVLLEFVLLRLAFKLQVATRGWEVTEGESLVYRRHGRHTPFLISPSISNEISLVEIKIAIHQSL